MTSTMFKVVVGALALQTSAQEMMLGQPAHVQVSSMSAMGPDGQMHTSVHKVITQTSDDGMQKRIAEVECKDGECSKSVSQFFAPSGFLGMPGMARISERFRMPMPSNLHQRMPMVMGCMHKMHDHMHHMIVRMHNAMPQMGPSGHFLAPRVIIIDDPAPAPQPQQVSPDFKNVGLEDRFDIFVGLAVGLPAIFLVTLILERIYRCVFGKAPARERPLQELGAPLAPEEQAELGAGPLNYEPRVQVQVAPVIASVEKTETPTQAYLFKLYERAAHKNEKKVAQAVLLDVYAKALQRVQ
mmetsp:Transcript_83358/g.131947  ORF Transcript_83358/g.131947 Transcript_83358/m.131947 type:complete len:298 (+) Transcript_83358:107-1000(+)